MDGFSPIAYRDGYLPIEDHGLIGDGASSALVGRDGGIKWMCVPRFDAHPLFAAILDGNHGGEFRIAPAGLPAGMPAEMMESRQQYLRDSGVLVTEMRTADGLLRVTDALTLQAGATLSEEVDSARQELLRFITVEQGYVDVDVHLNLPRGARMEHAAGGWAIHVPQLRNVELRLVGNIPLEAFPARVRMHAGERAWIVLHWNGAGYRRRVPDPEELLDNTVRAWNRWLESFCYEGPEIDIVRRSAVTLKLLDHFRNGAIVAAPTSSLPEFIGGERNWDYRYAWIRDAAFSVYALYRIGFPEEAGGFLGWVLDAAERGGRPRVLYDLDGNAPPAERIDPEFLGYRSSCPVRWGNGAADQVQHDVYGEILDCAYQWIRHHGTLDEGLWARLTEMVDAARNLWRTGDHGIWEVRTPARPFTYSAALCHVAIDRGVRIAERFDFPAPVAAWRSAAEEIRRAILEEAWDPNLQSLTEHLGGGGLDASLLSLPLRRVIPADHPRMIATADAIRRRLDAGGGLLYRYLPEESPDGIAGGEGAFLLCSFWMVDNLAAQGRRDDAMDLYHSLCGRASKLGLFSEQIDPSTGAFLGNFPQAFSHIGAISSGVNLARQCA